MILHYAGGHQRLSTGCCAALSDAASEYPRWRACEPVEGAVFKATITCQAGCYLKTKMMFGTE